MGLFYKILTTNKILLLIFKLPDIFDYQLNQQTDMNVQGRAKNEHILTIILNQRQRWTNVPKT